MSGNTTEHARLVELTVDVVSAYVSNNPVPVQELGGLIASVYASISGRSKGTETSPSTPEAVKPSSTVIKRSIGQDGLISFIDGKSYKTLKRHLTGHGLSPAQYRTKFGLPADYPMVASSYSERRSALAKSIGLGQIARAEAKATSEEQPKTASAPAKTAGRKAAAERKPAAEAKAAPRKKAA
jgi:predicted transcriptional regulator